MIISGINSIDFENKFGEKQAKDLTTSFIRMLSDVSNKLEILCENNKKDYYFTISFDNNSSLTILTYIDNNKIKTEINYTDCYANKLEMITLQDALNINKYVLEIQGLIKKNFNNENYNFKAFYTEQPIDKIFPMYKEKEIGLECNIFIKSKNIKE